MLIINLGSKERFATGVGGKRRSRSKEKEHEEREGAGGESKVGTKADPTLQ